METEPAIAHDGESAGARIPNPRRGERPGLLDIHHGIAQTHARIEIWLDRILGWAA